jgi:hypothetical protein
MSDLKGKVAVVTAASKGIGAAIAKSLSAAGAAVVDSTSVFSTTCRSKVERLMTLSMSAVAVCCCRDSRSSLSRRVYAEARKNNPLVRPPPDSAVPSANSRRLCARRPSVIGLTGSILGWARPEGDQCRTIRMPTKERNVAFYCNNRLGAYRPALSIRVVCIGAIG